jgi:hypothetical protein
MSPREAIAYGLLIAFMLAMALGWARWRAEVRRDRMLRWGTPLSARDLARRARQRRGQSAE